MPRGRPKGSKSQKSIELIEAAKEILREIQPATVRAVCYRLFVAELIPDMSAKSTGRVSKLLVWAREHDEIPWHWIVDEQRRSQRAPQWSNPEEFVDSVKDQYRKDRWEHQENYIEVWSEKGTVGGTVWPVLREYGVTFRVMKGFGSATVLHSVAELSRGRPMIALYVGDYDPSGMCMSERDIPKRLEKYNGRVDLRRIALVRDDCDDLPDFDADDKEDDTRYQWFVENYGEQCWELDAMSPVDLRERVREEIEALIDWDAWEQDGLAEDAECETIDRVLGNWQDMVNGRNTNENNAVELSETSVDLFPYQHQPVSGKDRGACQELVSLATLRQDAFRVATKLDRKGEQLELFRQYLPRGLSTETLSALAQLTAGEPNLWALSCLWSYQQGPLNQRPGYDSLFSPDRDLTRVVLMSDV
jgi:hypothetical protein